MPAPLIIGIDLGTSTSEVAILKNGRPEVIRAVRGSEGGILPSVVGMTEHGRLGVGREIEAVMAARPDQAIIEVKRRMGTSERVLVAGESYTPSEISAVILKHLREEAERYLGAAVEEAVITVPAYFNDLQRAATRSAAEIAGLKVRRLINEPTAAALAYGVQRPGVEEKILVYDLGGGTLDVTVLELSEGILDVLATTGNAELGGKDFDKLLMQHLREECRRQTEVDPFSVPRLRHLLRNAAKEAKETLSQQDSARVLLEMIGRRENGLPLHFDYTLTRDTFESLIRPLVESTRTQIEEALGAKGLAPADIQTVLFVGGSTRIPLVRDFVGRYFGGRVWPAAVDPDEAVALGAAVLSGMESRLIDPEWLVVTDVSSWTFGIATVIRQDGGFVEDVFDPVIRKNSTIPRTERKTYQTLVDNQREVRIQVFQGDEPFCAANTPVGELVLDQIPAGSAGQDIEVEMSYNLSGEIEVKARVKATGWERKGNFWPDGIRMSESEVGRARHRLLEKSPASSSAQAAGLGAPLAPPTAAPDPEGYRASPLYPTVSALMEHAEEHLKEYEMQVRIRVSQVLDQLKTALLLADEVEVKRKQTELTELLFRVA